jgi:DNA-binding LytR/AlgR family response regulator
LSALPWVQCVGEADDVPAAREAIATLAPDLVLLDVQMPSGSGFDVLDGLETVPAVVFVTAYDTYAVRAFQANALDYLVKPVEAPRLLEALQRARQREVVAAKRRSRAARWARRTRCSCARANAAGSSRSRRSVGWWWMATTRGCGSATRTPC